MWQNGPSPTKVQVGMMDFHMVSYYKNTHHFSFVFNWSLCRGPKITVSLCLMSKKKVINVEKLLLVTFVEILGRFDMNSNML